jgi:hypothetical protein
LGTVPHNIEVEIMMLCTAKICKHKECEDNECKYNTGKNKNRNYYYGPYSFMDKNFANEKIFVQKLRRSFQLERAPDGIYMIR